MFKSSLFGVALALSFLSVAPSNLQALPSSTIVIPTDDITDEVLGLGLETNFWSAVQNSDLGWLNSQISPAFQALSDTGVLTRDQEIAGLMQADITGFSINNVVVTRKHSIIVITYTLTTTGTGITDGPNMSTWKKTDHGWKMVSHAFFPFLLV